MPDTTEVSPLKNQHYQAVVSIGLNSSQMLSAIRVLDTGMVPKLIWGDVLDPSWLDSIRQRDVLDTHSAFDTMLKVRGTIDIHPRMGVLRARINLGDASKLVIPVV